MAAAFDHGDKPHVPDAIVNTFAGRLLEAILADPTLPRSAAREVPRRGARAANDLPAIARRTESAPTAGPEPVAAGWSPEEVEAAKAAADRRDRHTGLRLVGGACALVALAITLTLALPRGAAPSVDGSPVTEAPEAPLVIDEPLVVNAPDDEVTVLEPLVIDRRTAGVGD